MRSVFAVGDIHSIEYGDDTFFLRVTGGDVETKKTLTLRPREEVGPDRRPGAGPAVVRAEAVPPLRRVYQFEIGRCEIGACH